MDSNFSTELDFDGALDFYIESHEAFLAAFADRYYTNVIEPDEQKFVDKG
jgi:hypothetical protein